MGKDIASSSGGRALAYEAHDRRGPLSAVNYPLRRAQIQVVRFPRTRLATFLRIWMAIRQCGRSPRSEESWPLRSEEK